MRGRPRPPERGRLSFGRDEDLRTLGGRAVWAWNYNGGVISRYSRPAMRSAISRIGPAIGFSALTVIVSLSALALSSLKSLRVRGSQQATGRPDTVDTGGGHAASARDR